MTEPTTQPTTQQRRRLRAHFGFARMPFHKAMRAAQMYDSQSQRELVAGLEMWTEVGGLALLTGPTGVGKSISLRRFLHGLDERRFHVVQFSYLPGTVTGFLRSLSRALGLRMRLHGADLFDAACEHLAGFEQAQGPHPLIVIDNAEGLSVPVLDVLRRLTAHDLDAEQHFSLLLAGTDDFARTLQLSALDSLRSRFAYAHVLRAFTLEDSRNYLRFHLERAEVDPAVISDEACRKLFQASQGRPRQLNQLVLNALITAAANGRDTIDGRFMQQTITAHPLFRRTDSAG
jgi:type II secretory pathway predicted ATPase ExeA